MTYFDYDISNYGPAPSIFENRLSIYVPETVINRKHNTLILT